MLDPNVTDNLPEVPEAPPKRTFKVTRPGTEVVIEAHAVDETPSGSLMFFEYGFAVTPTGFKPESKLRRSLAAGTWTDLEEVFVVRPQRSSLIIH